MEHHYKVSVLVSTYNHEKYISEALESILWQDINFDCEIVVCDDASNDRTREIVDRYQKRHPNRIRTLYNEKNLGTTKNLQQGLAECSGEYIAILEGDDYWTSPYKLQKQVDFLDQHKECSFCFNGLLFLIDDLQIYKKPERLEKSSYTTSELIAENFIGNFSTCMYRNKIVKKLPPEIFDFFTVDWMFNISCSQFGSIGCIPTQMTAYRKHSAGVWSSKKLEDQIEQMINLIPLYDRALNFKYTKDFTRVLRQYRLRFLLSKKCGFIYRIIKKITPDIFIKGFKKILQFN